MTEKNSNFSSIRNIAPGTWLIKGIGGTKLFAHGIGDIFENIIVEKQPDSRPGVV
jgi:hypothetical protein